MRDRVPEEPHEFPVGQTPDWVCEVALRTLKADLREVRHTLEVANVPHYWILDAGSERFITFELLEGKLIQTLELFAGDEVSAIPPFESFPTSLNDIFGLET